MNSPLSLRELKQFYRENYSDHPLDDADRFIDAFSHGPFHEPSETEQDIAANLPIAIITDLVHNAIRGAITGSALYQEKCDELTAMMELFDSIGDWSRKILDDPNRLLCSFDKVRTAIEKALKESRNQNLAISYWYLMLAELAVRKHMGLSLGSIAMKYGECL